MADKVAVLGNGTVLRYGTPDSVFGHHLSTRFRVTGRIVAIKTSEVASVMSVQVGDSQTQIVIDIEEAQQYKIGEEVIVATKAFKPIMLPIA
jgi:molybdate transport system ATP-binding protein